jgi:ADP-heptose:LPS heptosyltransferase
VRRLLIRPGAIGDTIASLPALAWLCRGVDAELWVPARNVPLVRHLAPVRSFQEVQLDLLELDPPPRLVERLRGFDEVVSWYGAARAEFRDALARYTTNSRIFDALPPRNLHVFAGDHYMAQIGAPEAGAEPGIPVARRPRGFVAIQPFSGSPRKNWPLAAFAEVAAELSRVHGLAVEWCAGPEETLAGARRFDTLDGVIEWLSGASIYLGNDSGISHLAAACGVPAVAVFVASDARVWAPRGAHVAVVDRPSDGREVFTAADSLLRGALL